MKENFKEICGIISSNTLFPSFKNCKESVYSNEELGYLWISENLLENKTSVEELQKVQSILFLKSFDDLCSVENFNQTTYADSLKKFKRFISTYGLSFENSLNNSGLKFKRPRHFQGIVYIEMVPIFINSSKDKLFIDCIDEKFKFCKNRLTKKIELDTSNLGFSGVIKTKTDEVKYERQKIGIKNVFEVENVNIKISKVFDWILLFGVDIHHFMNYKIDQFIGGNISSTVILEDIDYLSLRFNISNLKLSELLIHLMKQISTGNVDRSSYQLFLTIHFLILSKKVSITSMTSNLSNTSQSKLIDEASIGSQEKTQKPNHKISILKLFKSQMPSWNKKITDKSIQLDPIYSFPITHNPLISQFDFINLSNNIVITIQNIITANGTGNESLIEVFRLFLKYKEIGIPLNSFFVSKVFALFSPNRLSGIFEYKLNPSNEKCFPNVTSVFTENLNDLLKNNTSIEELYQLFAKNFKFESKSCRSNFVENILQVHKRRIKKSSTIEQLKIIKESILKCEKTFGLRDLESDKMIKDRAESLLMTKQQK